MRWMRKQDREASAAVIRKKWAKVVSGLCLLVYVVSWRMEEKEMGVQERLDLQVQSQASHHQSRVGSERGAVDGAT